MLPNETIVQNKDLEEIVAAFKLAWQSQTQTRPNIADFLGNNQAGRLKLLWELVNVDLECRFRAGESVRVEEYLQRFPDLAGEPDSLFVLIRAEWHQRVYRQQTPHLDEYLRRFPQYREHLLQTPLTMLTVTAEPGEPGDAPALPENLPARVGRYRLENEIAHGGMGLVVRVRDEQFDRPLAMKVVLLNVHENADLKERFQREARLTGQMQHPGVPPVQEMGELEDGRPYFIMKLVKGQSLHDLLRARSSPAQDLPRQVSIFEQICQTLAYAHARGIIHRDLKPGNVMVGAFGEVQVMDWGLAKLLGAKEQPSAPAEPQGQPISSVFNPLVTPPILGETVPGSVLGTPAFMAPEQARGEVEQLDLRCDVFGLGGILCAILTGKPPFSAGDKLANHRLAMKGDLTHANARLDACGADTELIQIAKRCLAPERAERYADAGKVAQAVVDYQELVRERLRQAEVAKTRVEEERKRLLVEGQKRRVTLVLASAVLVVLAVGMVGTSLMLVRAKAAEKDAVEKKSQANKATATAQRNWQLAQEANVSLLDLAEELKPIAGTQLQMMKRILKLVADNNVRLLAEGGETLALLEIKAQMLNQLSRVYMDTGDTSAALEAGLKAQNLYQKSLLQREPDNADWRAGLALSHARIGLAHVYQGHLPETVSAWQTALQIRQQLVETDPANLGWQNELANIHDNIGNLLTNMRKDYHRGEAAYREALKIRQGMVKRDPNPKWQSKLAYSYEKIADALYWKDDARGSLKLYAQAQGILDDLAARIPNNADWQMQRARVLLSTGQVHAWLNDNSKAIALFKQSLALGKQFADMDPDNFERQRPVMQCRLNLADDRKEDNLGEALKEKLAISQEILPLVEARAKTDPHNAEWQVNVASSKAFIGSTLIGLAQEGIEPAKNLEEARSCLEAALAIMEPLVIMAPDNTAYMERIQQIQTQFKSFFLVQENKSAAWEAARKKYKVSEEFFERQTRQEPDNSLWQQKLAACYREAASHNIANLKDYAAGVAGHRKALDIFEDIARREPKDSRWLNESAKSYESLSTAFILLAERNATQLHPKDEKARTKAINESKELADSLAAIRKSLDLREQLAAGEPNKPQWQRDLASAYRERARGLRSQGDHAGANAAYRKFLDALDRLFSLGPDEANADPFTTHSNSAYLTVLHNIQHPQAEIARQLIKSRERDFTLRPSYPERLDDLLGAYIDLVRDLTYARTENIQEARWALRRGLGLLSQQQAAKKLHPAQERLIPFFEHALRKLPADEETLQLARDRIDYGRGVSLDRSRGFLQRALDRMDYSRVAAHILLDRKRPRDLLQLMDRELVDAAKVPWAMQVVEQQLVTALLREPKLRAVVLETAVALQKEDSKALGAEGWALIATLKEKLSSALLKAKRSQDAEKQVREALAIRETTRPNDWPIFNTRAMLGAVLLGQQKYAEAEPLLITGYDGMQQRAAKMPPEGKARLTEVEGRLAELFEATRKKDESKRQGKLTEKKPEEIHEVTLTAGKPVVIEMRSAQFDTYLRLTDAKGHIFAENDDIDLASNNRNSRIVFIPTTDGVYRIVATSYPLGGRGEYEIVVRQYESERAK